MNNNDQLIYDLVKETRTEIRELRLFIQEHMENEDARIVSIDKRLSKLEWKANGVAAVMGVIGSFIFLQVRKMLNID